MTLSRWANLLVLGATLSVLGSCAGRDTVSLRIFLRTDYQPLREFISAELVVDAQPESRLARIDGGYIRPGEPLADFASLAPADRRAVTVRLLRLGGNLLAESTVYIQHDRDLVLTVAVTRDCGGVTCDDIGGLPARCLAGKCQDARCLSGNEPFCEKAECTIDEDCEPESPCAKPTCEAGVCFSDGEQSSCPHPLVCDVESGACFQPPTECQIADDCTFTSECTIAECALDLCIYKPAADETPCSAGKCMAGSCVTDTCTNSVKDGDESDIDCGGSCSKCGLGKVCTQHADCLSDACDGISSLTCEAPDTCGNGKIETGEGCDDGETVAGDGCNASCLLEDGSMCTTGAQCESGTCDITGSMTCVQGGMCGNNMMDAGEACDDGGTAPGDGCSENCLLENGEPCTLDGQCESTVCDVVGSNTCEDANVCGNGKTEGTESCDDGNILDGDGCTSMCKLENGQACTLDTQCASGVCDTTSSNTCEPASICGNGKLETGEGCDDGGTASGDGCSDMCFLEDGEACTLSSACGSGFCIGSCLDPEEHYAKANVIDNRDRFGIAVAVDGDTLAVGAPGDDSCDPGIGADENNNSCSWAGAVHVFRKTGGVWAREAFIKSSNPGVDDNFGARLKLEGDTLAVTAYGERSCDDGVGANQNDNNCTWGGAAYVFTRSGTTWSQQAYIKATNSEANDRFGYNLALSGDLLAIGAFQEGSCATGVDGNQNDNMCANAGAVYVYRRTGTTWTDEAYLKASNTDAGDNFGLGLGADGDTIVVGARNEASCATTIGGNQADNNCASAGAAYVFKYNGANWAQEAYLKGSALEAGDWFAYFGIELEGDRLAVPAIKDDSCDRTMPTDNGCTDSGAVYFFERTGSTWSEQAFIKPDLPSDLSIMGTRVRLRGNQLLVGAQ